MRIDDAVWSVGTKLVPNGDSSLTLAYGHHDGGDAATVDGHYDATARLRLAARYTENLTSNSEDIADALASVDTTLPGGVFTDANGAPINIGNNFFGLQNGIYRQRRASATASLLYTRDIFSVSVVQQSERIVAASSALNAGNGGKGTYGSLSWAHDLSPSLQSNMFVQYGTISSLPNALTQNTVAQTSSNGTSIVLNATLTYILTDKLKTFAQYGFNRNESSTPGQSTTQNFILVGVHKQF